MLAAMIGQGIEVNNEDLKQWTILEGGGRHRNLDIELLQHMSDKGTEDQVIADFFKVSRRTIICCQKEAGIEKRNWSPLSIKVLREASSRSTALLYMRADYMQCIKHVLHHSSGEEGEVGVIAGLETLGYKVRREDVRSILRTFSQDTVLGPDCIICRVYSVPWINSLWHIDGHHKLNPWGIIMHGSIDGYSRMAVFMVASNNNQDNFPSHLQ
jgi:hypothetical protein